MHLKSGIKATDVPFNKEQLEALEVLFPENTNSMESPYDMYYNAGKRDVVRYVRQNIEAQSKKAEHMPTRNLTK